MNINPSFMQFVYINTNFYAFIHNILYKIKKSHNQFDKLGFVGMNAKCKVQSAECIVSELRCEL